MLAALKPQYLRDLERVTTRPEAARLYCVDPKTVQNWIDTGKVAADKIGGVWIISYPSLIAFRQPPETR